MCLTTTPSRCGGKLNISTVDVSSTGVTAVDVALDVDADTAATAATNQRCRAISDSENRRSGSTNRMCRIKCSHSTGKRFTHYLTLSVKIINKSKPCDMKNGMRNLPATTMERRSCSVFPSNGNAPQTRTYKTTPRLQMSARGPSYSKPRNTSGAAYGGDPHHVRNILSGVKVLLNPKSANYTNWKLNKIIA